LLDFKNTKYINTNANIKYVTVLDFEPGN